MSNIQLYCIKGGAFTDVFSCVDDLDLSVSAYVQYWMKSGVHARDIEVFHLGFFMEDVMKFHIFPSPSPVYVKPDCYSLMNPDYQKIYDMDFEGYRVHRLPELDLSDYLGKTS